MSDPEIEKTALNEQTSKDNKSEDDYQTPPDPSAWAGGEGACEQAAQNEEHDNSIYYEIDVTCPELTLSGDSGILDPDCQSLNCTLDLRSTDSNASIDIGTQSDFSFLSPIKDSIVCQYGTKRPPLMELSPDLEHKYKRMKFSRERVRARPPLWRRKKRKPTGDSDKILSVSPEKVGQSALRATAAHYLDQTCSLQ